MTTDFIIHLVEDNEDDRLLFADALKRDQVPAHIRWHSTAEDALAALADARENAIPNLIISDLDMPGIGGHAFLERIRCDERLRRLPVIVMTSSLSSEDREFCSLADHYFIKPKTRFEWGVITSLIRRYIAQIRRQPSSTEGGVRTTNIPQILHVEDHIDDQDLFRLAFQRSGITATLQQVGSSAAARDFLQQQGHIALVVLDLSLPDGSGTELLEDLRTNPRFRQIPVIVLSGSERFSDIQACRDLYVIDYVVKPKSPRQMTEFISTFRQWFDSALAQSLVRNRET